MVARRKGNHPSALRRGIEAAQGIVGASKLERARTLQMFPFEKNLNPKLRIEYT
jgi:hypothetical protein